MSSQDSTTPGDNPNSCQIVGPLGIIVQGVLGVLSFLVLILKRHREKPKRQWKIWMMDTSKQMASMVVAHVLNVSLAVVLSRQNEDNADPCNWYFVTILFDTTLGMVICIAILRAVEGFLESRGNHALKSGNYVRVITPEEQIADDAIRKQQFDKSGEKMGTSLLRPIIRIDFGVWATQLAIWITIVVIAKSLLLALQYAASSLLRAFAHFILQLLDNHPNWKLIVVMVIVPFIMNAIQFWVQDSVLKKNEFSQIEKQYAMSEIYEIELQEMIGANRNSAQDFGAGASSMYSSAISVNGAPNGGGLGNGSDGLGINIALAGMSGGGGGGGGLGGGSDSNDGSPNRDTYNSSTNSGSVNARGGRYVRQLDVPGVEAPETDSDQL